MVDPRPAYLARLDAALVGPSRMRRSLVQEASDHLDDATEALLDAGSDELDAARRAVADFGPVDEVAEAFQRTLAVAAARRTAWLLLGVLGCQPFLWDSGLELAARRDAGAADSALTGLLDGAIEVGGGLLIACAVVAAFAAGVGNRWWPAGRATARMTALVALGAAIVVPMLCLTMTVATGGAPMGFWLLMFVLLIAPLGGVGISAQRTWAAA